MSSHHVVREKQEPALIILGLANFQDELLGQLLEWSPTVIATPATAEMLNAYGIKVDCIIADQLEGHIQSDIKLLPSNGGALLNAALNFLVSNAYSAVNLITDNFDLDDYVAYADKINLVIFNGGQKIYPVRPGFSKWQKAGETIQIISAYNTLHSSGLVQIAEKYFKTTRDGFFSLNFDGPFLFIAEQLY